VTQPEIKLPALHAFYASFPSGIGGFTGDDMQAYARAAVEEDRARTAASPDVAKMVELLQEVLDSWNVADGDRFHAAYEAGRAGIASAGKTTPEAAKPFVSYYARTEPLPAQGSLHPIKDPAAITRYEINTHANALRSYIDGLSGEAFQGAITALGSLRNIIDALGAAATQARAAVGAQTPGCSPRLDTLY
jgi:hypothetical protein